ncbi:ATP-binding cassette domain-containing protein (plasmid) [Rhizobium sp. CB3171]|uniref:ABC transporter ATP-binding protein n=1 Tax=Rhizobium sp. CB3171 TaxID=3039157 RepID=UPI0024B04342|nr:ATP-binding cassette domain-containing protein [Rhizobium sp. CB3171]WFU05237.1 ATP-binding cassette domain-containing protein [Rhizobium sp. CB3171]
MSAAEISAAIDADDAVGGGLPISLTHVRKSFGKLDVLSNFDLEVPAGQFLAVVGRSGGGKSTLMRLIAGLDASSGGHVAIDGRTVDRLHPAVRLLFQEARLIPWQRVIENVGIARGLNWRETARAVLADVGLQEREEDWPTVLSGGQRQRVALARALVSRPQILLLDEPFGALDALTRIDMHRLLESIWADRGFTTVLITHDVAEAVALADRVVVLHQGTIALDIDIDLDRPRRELADPRAVDLQRRILEAV